MTQTPLLMVDNFFDLINGYPLSTLTVTNEITGREGFRVADYRRERSWWQPATDGGGAPGSWIQAAFGASATAAPDYLFLDRGHNLWGKSIQLIGDGTTRVSLTVPALVSGAFVPGGDPSAGFCVTEEGALYTLFAAPPVANAWRFDVLYVASFIPVVPGVMLGKRVQLLGYSSVRDEDAMMRSEITEQSQALYRGTAKRYTARTLLIDLKYIGAAEYDGTMRTLRAQLFERDQPAVIAMDWSTKPERAWMYQYDGTTYTAPMNFVYRGLQYRMREVGPLLR